MGQRFARHLGPVGALSSTQFTLETASGRPAVCCPLCEMVTEVGPTHRIHKGGNVTPIWSCDWCPFLDFIELESVHEEVCP